MNIFEINKARIAENMKSIYGEGQILNSTLDNIEKGRKPAAQGEIREYSGKKYQKVGKDWIPVKENGDKKIGDDSGEKIKVSMGVINQLAVKLHYSMKTVNSLIKKHKNDLEAVYNELQYDLEKKNQTQTNKIEQNMETEKESGTPKNVKEKFEEKKNEYLYTLKSVKELGSKKKGESFFRTQNRNKLWGRIETLDKQMNKIANNETEVKRIFKELGINASTTSSTAIRGFNNYSPGYDMSSFHDGLIQVISNKDTFEPLISKLEERGFEIKSKSAPSNFPGGSIYTITVSPFYPELSTDLKSM